MQGSLVVPVSAFDLYSIGIGPSSSHTVGPMRAARLFAAEFPHAVAIKVELFGSLGATGRGHHSDSAVLLGLEDEDPATVDTTTIADRVAAIQESGTVLLAGKRQVPFEMVLHRRRSLPYHPNGMIFTAWDEKSEISARTYYSVGGGFLRTEEELRENTAIEDVPRVGDGQAVANAGVPAPGRETGTVRAPAHPFATGDDLLAACAQHGMAISEIMRANERAERTEDEIRDGLLDIWAVMRGCVERGLHAPEGVLPGGLKVRRRAPALFRDLTAMPDRDDPLHVIDWVNLYALAVNEENAAGGRVVTAPTNGAAGIIPAVLHYYRQFVPGATDDGVVRFLLTAAAVGILIKGAASISGAEVGCQGEVGSAAAMAAAGLCEILGGTPEQVENAAEIALEHSLGLTCDPVGGLVQVPCIERNAIASVKAINAARLALRGDGVHRVSLDMAIATMRETGRDMSTKYKETSLGGLAVTVVEC
ncbi:L-serine dehydratase [Actinoplanes tereljensis]|uniref:L-serine dehydratase n=1 Tax=Paractinoplanes tereljensis TaxID=571912 RepID=A0A919TT41_9ACTN|nr:L-serine ammonia-lyase [Actinoplanes tereljensis]GIF20000.1 L-serine dehydratase [Actinoplanes tereljensis]